VTCKWMLECKCWSVFNYVFVGLVYYLEVVFSLCRYKWDNETNHIKEPTQHLRFSYLVIMLSSMPIVPQQLSYNLFTARQLMVIYYKCDCKFWIGMLYMALPLYQLYLYFPISPSFFSIFVLYLITLLGKFLVRFIIVFFLNYYF